MPNITLNEVDLYYEIQGKGEPLMLVAGLASDSQSWQPIIEDLSKHHLVITPDNRGVGRTKPQDIEITIQQITDDIIGLIRELGLSRVNLLGHSMGGFVALDCAIRYPEYIANLILVGTSAKNSDRNNTIFLDWVSYLESGMNSELWFRNIFYWIFTQRFFDNKESLNDALKFVVEYPYPQSLVAFKKQVNAIKQFNCIKDLNRINLRTMLLYGENDLLFPPAENVEILKKIPGSVVSIINNAAHSIHMENPQSFTDCILNFLVSLNYS